MSVDLLFSICEIVLVLSFIFTDIFYLRALTIIGEGGYMGAGLFAGYDLPGMKAVIIFSGITVLINLYYCVLLYLERKPLLLPESLKKIYTEMFSMMTTHDFSRIFKLAETKVLQKNEHLSTQGEPVKQLLLIKKGITQIFKDNHAVTTLGSGFFIGEMSFLTGEMATATVTVSGESCECLVWDRAQLEQLGHKNPELHEKLKMAIAFNLIKKIGRQTT